MAAVTPDSPGLFAAYRAKPRLGRAKLRVGVFADRARQPRWILEALARVGASDFAEIAVIATRDGGAASSLLWSAYGAIDRLAFAQGPDWSQPLDLAPLVPRERRIACDPDSGSWRARIRELRLDVAVAIGAIDDASLEGLARHGVWRYCFGESQGTDPSLAALREVIDGAPVTASALRIHRGGGKPDRLACPSWSRAFPFSLARSRDKLFGKSATFLARALTQLHASGGEWLESGTDVALPLPEERFPGALRSVVDLTRLGARVARLTAEHCLTVGQWSLAFRFSPSEPWDGSLDGFFRLTPPKDRFWADPFPISKDGRHFIFFEELPFDTGKGHISVVEVDRDGHASAPVMVLERDYHLSYPFLIEEGGGLYMIPETANNHTVEIYRCIDFPYRWRRERVLIEGLFCCDATVHRAGERLWMFANVGSDNVEVNDELHLFSSERLLGDWKPHRANPVKSDVRSSRPAGRLFWHGNRLYRPAQIGAPIYGSGVALQEVSRLGPDGYREQEARRIVPCASTRGGSREPVLGIHTINRAGDLSVTDAFTRRRRF